MTPLQFENISIFKLNSGEILGFHNENLEVASLSTDLWNSLSLGKYGEELIELKYWSDSVNLNAKRFKNEQKTRTLTLNSTQLCNLKCIYCAAGGDGTYGSPVVKLDLKQGLPQLEWLMSKMTPGETFQINFLGGEPLLYPKVIREIASSALQFSKQFNIFVRFSVVTNGTRLIEQEVINLLQDFKMAVTISIDGPPEIQDKFRPKANGQGSSIDLEKSLKKLLLIKSDLPSIGLAAVFHKDHVGVLETYQYFLKWDVDFYELNFSHIENDREASLAFSQGMTAVADFAIIKGGEEELRKIRNFDGFFDRLDEQLKLENFCGAGKSLLSMDAKGDLYSCPWDINDKNLKLNSKIGLSANKLAPFQAPQIDKNHCRSCWAKYLCGGGCSYIHKNSTGFSQKIDPIFCERTQSLILTALMYYEKYRRN